MKVKTNYRPIKISLPEEMRSIDKASAEMYGVPTLLLMENAGRAVADAARKILKKKASPHKDFHVAVLAGGGNNGGDAFCCARHLMDFGGVEIFFFGDAVKLSPDAKIQYDICQKLSLTIYQPFAASTQKAARPNEDIDTAWEHFLDFLGQADLIIDGLLGTGFQGEVRENFARVIQLVNERGAQGIPIVAIDIASGLDAATGKGDIAVVASETVTLGLAKPGHYLLKGKDLTGKLTVDSIGIPFPLLQADDLRQALLTDELLKLLLPKRPNFAHKGSVGRVLVIAGSEGMTGAAYLSSLAALKVGAGLVTLAVPATVAHILAAKCTEVMTRSISGACIFGEKSCDEIISLVNNTKPDAILIGPGLGRNDGTVKFVRRILKCLLPKEKDFLPRIILDADALYAISPELDLLRALPKTAPPIITPHLGELARLLDITVEELRLDFIGIVRKAAISWQTVVVAKCESTIVATPEGNIFFTDWGNAGMATAGTGDVLAGTIAGLVKECSFGEKKSAANFAAADIYLAAPALAGVGIHGMAGDMAAETFGDGLIAGDILSCLPLARKRLNER